MNHDISAPQKLNEAICFENSFVRLHEAYFEDQDTQSYSRVRIEHRDAVCAFLYDASRKGVLMVRQYRYPLSQRSEVHEGLFWEIPAGLCEEDESPQTTIVREVLEETGYQISTPRLAFSTFVAPGLLDQKLHCFVGFIDDAQHVSGAGGGVPSEHEHIQVELISLERLISNPTYSQDIKTRLLLEHFLRVEGISI